LSFSRIGFKSQSLRNSSVLIGLSVRMEGKFNEMSDSISESNQDLESFDLGRKIIGRKGIVLYCCSVVNAAVQNGHPKRSDWQ
jgi:hypothetical protein